MSTTEDLGFLILDIDNNLNTNVIFNTIKKFIKDKPYDQVVLFNSRSIRAHTQNVPILHLSHAKFFTGKLIVFDTPSLIISKTFTNISNKYFYATHTPWIGSSNHYNQWKSLLGDDSLKIIANNQLMYDLYDICWNKPIGIVENFDYESLRKII